MEAIGRTRDDIVRGSGAFREATGSLGPVTAKDETGAITVTLDEQGRISAILLLDDLEEQLHRRTPWRPGSTTRPPRPGSPASSSGAQPSSRPTSGRPGGWRRRKLDADDLAQRLSEAVDRDRSGSVDASMQVMRDLLHELVEPLEEVRDEVREHLSKEYTGRSASGHVKATVAGNGTLLDLTFDHTWLDSAHPANIGREATQALHEAYRQAGGDDVETIVARSPLGRIQRLSEDPVALARAIGLRN